MGFLIYEQKGSFFLPRGTGIKFSLVTFLGVVHSPVAIERVPASFSYVKVKLCLSNMFRRA